MTKKEFNSNLKAARNRIYAMDEVDGVRRRDLKLIAGAIGTGLMTENPALIFEGLTMLLDILTMGTLPLSTKTVKYYGTSPKIRCHLGGP